MMYEIVVSRYVVFSILLSYSCVLSANQIDKTKILGLWGCATSMELEEYRLSEFFNIYFQDDGKFEQNGRVVFHNADGEAIMDYLSESNWSLNKEILTIKNFQVKNYDINNEFFDHKYKITDGLLDNSAESTIDYQIKSLTDDELIYNSKGNDFDEFTWLSVTTFCVKEKDQKDVKAFD